MSVICRLVEICAELLEWYRDDWRTGPEATVARFDRLVKQPPVVYEYDRAGKRSLVWAADRGRP